MPLLAVDIPPVTSVKSHSCTPTMAISVLQRWPLWEVLQQLWIPFHLDTPIKEGYSSVLVVIVLVVTLVGAVVIEVLVAIL